MEVDTIFSVMASGSRQPFNDMEGIDPVTVLSNGTSHEVEFQGHHVIPWDVFKRSEFISALGKLFDPDSFAINGVALPARIDGNKASDSEFRSIVGGALHNGGHPAYTKAISNIITTFDDIYIDSLKTGKWGEFPDEAAWLKAQSQKIHGLVAMLKFELANPHSGLAMHNTDNGRAPDLAASEFWNSFSDKLFNDSTLTFDSAITAHPASPRMAVTVEIKTDQRRQIDYFLSPLEQHLQESLGER